MAEHLLVVDDDREIRKLLMEYLEQAGYRVSAVADGKAMRRMLDAHRVDLVILDLMLPGEDGLALCRDLRARSNLPVLMLTARGTEVDRIVGLEMGADDYLAKPFNPANCWRASRASCGAPSPCRRTSKPRTSPRFVSPTGRWTWAPRHLVAPDGLVVPLSGAEYRLLRVLLEHAQCVLSRDQLLELANGREAILFDRSIDVLVGRLRKRLRDDGREPHLVKTVRGEGYVLAVAVARA
jgi:two-component system OmpR family response regulator